MEKSELKRILEHLDKFFTAERAVNELSEGGINLYEFGGLGFIIDDLEDVLEMQLGMKKDDYGYTDLVYFIHELDMGRDYKEGCFEVEGKEVKLDSIDSFCNYIFKDNKEDDKCEEKTSLNDEELEDLFGEISTM